MNDVSENKKFQENRNIGPEDTIVIIDDLVRTGGTINRALAAIQENYPSTRIYTMALVV
jgi:adenine/guanine phosphoribosyltransferase-like PRPP-binding protein